MRFGLFGSAQARRGVADAAAGYRDFVEMNVEAEALGYHSTFLVEHHFTGIGQVSAPLALLGWVAARTTRLRLGTAVMVLPWHNPVLLAEQAATLDLMSGGRLEFGVGRGYRASEFSGFALPVEEAEARFDEALALIRRAWTSDTRFSHAGRYWRFEDIIVEPPPQQKPHPPIWIAAGSDASIRQVASRGANLLMDQFASFEQSVARLALFRAAVEAQGRRFAPASVAIARNCRIAYDAGEKEAALRDAAAQHRRTLALSQDPARPGSSHILSYAEPGAAEASALFGTPDTVAAEIAKLRAAGFATVLLNGGAAARENLRRFARDVMPGFVDS
jgi:alkanesulfonate monooxygenase SsuD/methylene tetrahydromethanopterin reductase-like flavin-dependent oxidoreductase (luciferase family)